MELPVPDDSNCIGPTKVVDAPSKIEIDCAANVPNVRWVKINFLPAPGLATISFAVAELSSMPLN